MIDHVSFIRAEAEERRGLASQSTRRLGLRWDTAATRAHRLSLLLLGFRFHLFRISLDDRYGNFDVPFTKSSLQILSLCPANIHLETKRHNEGSRIGVDGAERTKIRFSLYLPD
jgi:hypothetical protein